MNEQTKIDHIEYPKSLISKSWAQLEFIRKDAHEAMTANPDGHKAGYYADEINYVTNEMHNRRGAWKQIKADYDQKCAVLDMDENGDGNEI